MKPLKIFAYIILSTIMALGVYSCTEVYINTDWIPSLESHYLKASETKFTEYSAKATNETFSVTTINTPWTFTSVPSWISLNPSSGSSNRTVTMSISENPNAEWRTGIFYLSPSQKDIQLTSKAITVMQCSASASLDIDKTNITLPGSYTVYTREVTANCTWSASTTASWLSLSTSDATLQITATANTDLYYRSATISIKYGTNSTTLQVSQAPAQVTASATTLKCDNTASKFEVELTSDAAWSTVVSDSWINVSPASGAAGTSKLNIEIAPNESVNARTGAVTLKIGSSSRTQISIEQKGLYLDTEYQLLYFSSGSDDQILHVESNTNWVVESKPNWVNLSALKGSGSADLEVTTDDNPNTATREGAIILQVPGVSLQCIVDIIQYGKTFAATSNLLEFDASAASQQFSFYSDATWRATLSDSWFSASPLSGVGDATITVSVNENKSVNERTGKLSYLYADSQSDITIHQSAKYLTVDNPAFDFTSKGGSHLIDLATNEHWTAQVEHNVDWLTLSQSSGDGNGQITIAVKDNPSVNARSTAVVITPEYAQPVRILVSQKARQLKVSSESILLFARGGTSSPITIETDGTYTLSTEDSWFTITQGSDNTFTVTASAHTAVEARRGSVHIQLTDLKEGALSLDVPVVQAGEGGSFIFNPYEQDQDWNIASNDTISISIKAYTTDADWNIKGDYSVTIQVKGYTSDYDWNAKESGACNVSINPYGTDIPWGNTSETSGTIKTNPYSNDSNWNR